MLRLHCLCGRQQHWLQGRLAGGRLLRRLLLLWARMLLLQLLGWALLQLRFLVLLLLWRFRGMLLRRLVLGWLLLQLLLLRLWLLLGWLLRLRLRRLRRLLLGWLLRGLLRLSRARPWQQLIGCLQLTPLLQCRRLLLGL